MNKKIFFAGVVVTGITTAFITAGALKGVDVASMDKTANPRDDFYQYADGNWCKENKIPPSEARWTSFNIVAERNNAILKKIFEEAAANTKSLPESNIQKIGDFYRTAMDTLKLDKQGFAPLKPDFAEISKINNSDEVILAIANFHKKGIAALFTFDVGQDLKNSDKYIAYMGQGGLGLPDRDYYFKEDEKSEKIRQEYKRFIGKMFSEFGYKDDPMTTDVIMQIETELARSSMSKVECRNPEKVYNKTTIGELIGKYNHINFGRYLEQLNIRLDPQQEIIVQQPDFFKQLNQTIEVTGVEKWKIYLKWKLMCSTAKYLSSDIAKTSFDFYGTILNGTKEQKPRWKKTIESANGLIGEIVAQEFVKVAFSEESKQRVNTMVDNLRDAFKIRINKLDWMSEPTKQKAIEKLNSFKRKLGYPDHWKDKKRLEIGTESYLKNYYSANEFEFNEMIEKLHKPVDKTEWEMLPQTVNAQYNPVNNEIVFPAAIMQPPFFNAEADDAVNYGAIGAVIGHEFSHGFDDQGSKFDASGNMNNWWTPEDKEKFEQRTKILVDQYNKFAVEENVFVKGDLTLGENIADFAGLTIAYDAYQISLKGKPRKNIDGFTPEQRFFIGFAQVWKNNARPEYLRHQVMTDPHSPGRFRVIGPLSNMPEFYAAFGVKKGDKMFIDEKNRAVIW